MLQTKRRKHNIRNPNLRCCCVCTLHLTRNFAQSLNPFEHLLPLDVKWLTLPELVQNVPHHLKCLGAAAWFCMTAMPRSLPFGLSISGFSNSASQF